MVRGRTELGLPKTITSSPTRKNFSMNGRFHQRQCSRAVPSSRMNSKTERVPFLKVFTPCATMVPRTVAGSLSCKAAMVMKCRRSS